MFAILNVILVTIGGAIAFAEGRFNHIQMGAQALPWFNHGGNYADLIAISFVCVVAGKYVSDWSERQVVNAVLVSVVLSMAIHVAYYFIQPIPGHIIDSRYEDLARIPWGGWYHAMYTAWAFSIVLLFFFASPGADRFWVCLVLSVVFVPLAIWQPGWYNAKIVDGKGVIDMLGWIQAIAAWALIWLVGYWRAFGWLEP